MPTRSLDFCVSSTDSEEQKETARSLLENSIAERQYFKSSNKTRFGLSSLYTYI